MGQFLENDVKGKHFIGIFNLFSKLKNYIANQKISGDMKQSKNPFFNLAVKVLLWFGCAARNSNLELILFKAFVLQVNYHGCKSN
jgi:hypothetical protein